VSAYVHCLSLREAVAFVEPSLDDHDLLPAMVDVLRPYVEVALALPEVDLCRLRVGEEQQEVGTTFGHGGAQFIERRNLESFHHQTVRFV
jgi:hypothetical protein